MILGLAGVRLRSGRKGCKNTLQIFSGPAQLALRGVDIHPEFVRDFLVLEALDDYPFPLGDLEFGRYLETDMDLSESDRAMIFHGSALEWLGVEAERFA